MAKSKISKTMTRMTWTGMTKKKSDYIFVFFMLLAPILHFLVFWLYLNLQNIMLGFQHPVTGEWGLMNFERFFRQFALDWEMGVGIKTCLENTFISAGIQMFITMPTLIIVTYLLFKQFYGHMFMRIAYYIPAIVGSATAMILNRALVGAGGPLIMITEALGVQWSDEVLQSGLYNNWGTARIAFHITDMLGVSGGSVLLLTGAFSKIPKDLFDVGKIEGLGMFREFLLVCVPCAWSTVGIMWVMTFGNVWGNYQRVMMLTEGAYGTNNFAYYLFGAQLSAISSGGAGESTYNYPAAIGLLLTAIVAPATLLLRKLADKIVPPVEF